jgi:hypothetical protein
MFVMDPGPVDGIPVVLFHGTAAWSKLWWRTTAALKSDGYGPIVSDVPPFGMPRANAISRAISTACTS